MAERDDRFQLWMSVMDEVLEEFFAWLPEEVSERLDYSLESLDVLEAWLLRYFPTFEEAKAAKNTNALDGTARYIGETYRKLGGGRWALAEPNSLYHGYPVITDWRTGPMEDAPLTAATASTSRRRGNYISGILGKQLGLLRGEQEKIDLGIPKRFKIKTMAEEQFDYWLTLMDRGLAELFAELPAVVREHLDFSPASLDVLEAWLLARYPDVQASMADREVLTMDGVARYIGETIRRNAGGEWWFDWDDWTLHGLPQIEGPGKDLPPVCPLVLAREAIAERGGSHLHAALRNRRAAKRAKN